MTHAGPGTRQRGKNLLFSRSAVRMVAAARVCTVLLVYGVWPASAAVFSAEVTAPASRVLVMPFETNSREPRSYWLGEGSAVILSDSLLALGLPVMHRDERLHSFERLRVPVVQGLSYATIIRVGQMVGASQVIVGGVALEGGTLTIRAKPIFLDTGVTSPEISESGPLQDIFDIYDRLALRLVPGSSPSAMPENSHPPIVAFEQFIKGLLAEMPASKLSFLTEALRLAPGLQSARTAAWDVHNDLGEHDLALAEVRQVPPGHRLARQARFLASVSLIELKKYQEAFDELVRLNEEKSDATVLNNLGIVLLRQPRDGPGERAVSYFNEAASMEGLDSHFNLGYAYWLDGDAAAAAWWLREAVRRNPADHAAHFVLGIALDALGNAREGAHEKDLARRLSSTYEEWERTSPSGSVPQGLERMRMDLDLPDAARVENAIAAAGQRDQQQLAAFHLGAARRAYDAQRDGEAVSALQRTLYLSPYDHEGHLLLGRVYLRRGRVADAINALKISVWSSDTIPARLALAEAYEKAGMIDQARTELRTVLARNPSIGEASQRLERLSGR